MFSENFMFRLTMNHIRCIVQPVDEKVRKFEIRILAHFGDVSPDVSEMRSFRVNHEQ